MTTTSKRILSVTGGAITSIIVIGLIIGIVTFFWMLHLSYEPIMDTIDYFWTYGFAVILLILVLLPFWIFKNKRPYYSFGLLAGLIPVIFIVILNTIDYYNYLTPDDFDEKQWRQSTPKSYDNSRSLVKDKLAVGLSKGEIIELLGDDYIEKYSDDSTFVYQLDIARFTYLIVRFDETGVVKWTDYTYYD